MRLDVVGDKSNDCVTLSCEKLGCYVPCEHTGIVLSKAPIKPYASQALLSQLISAILSVQEDAIETLCEPVDICESGFRLGFPCVQCGFANYQLTNKILNLCGTDTICLYEVIGESQQFVDLSLGDYLPIYTAIVEWLNCARGAANGQTINSYLAIFGGVLLGYSNGVYSAELPNDPTILSIIEIIRKLAPIPFGAEIKFYVS